MQQTEEEVIYNKINLYYEISKKLENEILYLEGISEVDRFDVLMPIVDKLKVTADNLMEKYVNFLKDKKESTKNDIINILDGLLEYISIYKNKLYELYNK